MLESYRVLCSMQYSQKVWFKQQIVICTVAVEPLVTECAER